MLRKRHCAKNEIDAVPEEGEEDYKKSVQAAGESIQDVLSNLVQYGTRTNVINLKTDDSLESTFNQINRELSPKVIIVNHEKRLGIDTTCANLAIKYNMIYLSSYQIIKQHITNKTEWGKKLVATQTRREIILTTQVRDEFNEADFSPVHFDQQTVIDLFLYTIK